MTKAELAKIAEAADCKVLGVDDAGSAGHRMVLAALIRAFNHTESGLLCEPSLARRTRRPADIVLIDPEIGVHVVEVKGMTLDKIAGIEAGGQIRFRYGARGRTINPIVQVREAMFSVKDATALALDREELRIPFRYWVVFPLIRREEWIDRFSVDGFRPDEFLFADDLEASRLARRLGASDRGRSNQPIELCSLDQLHYVWRAFGDTSVLYATPEERQPRRPHEGTLGEQFDEAAESFKVLSDAQQQLSVENWESGPRLFRGVAGSGKTVVLANNLARRLERMQFHDDGGLFDARPRKPRLLAVCNNRTLAPYLTRKIDAACRQRTGSPFPREMVHVLSMNKLLYQLSTAGLWRYQRVGDAKEMVQALQYLDELIDFRQRDPQRMADLAYDAIYVDEGQDLPEEAFRLLKELCRVKPGGEPNLYVFYDDAQNLFGRSRPNWQSLGLNVRGRRSHVMTQCFRNTRPIVEAGFNVLYGACAPAGASLPTRDFGDLSDLVNRKLIEKKGRVWRVRFAPRMGAAPILSLAPDLKRETDVIVARLFWLIEEQEVRPQDILVLAHSRERVKQLAEAVRAALPRGVSGVHIPDDNKDQLLAVRGRLAVSTVASAKGYDAYCVLLASVNAFPPDVNGRASFYVGATRAIEYLEVFAYQKSRLASELDEVLQCLRGHHAHPSGG